MVELSPKIFYYQYPFDEVLVFFILIYFAKRYIFHLTLYY